MSVRHPGEHQHPKPTASDRGHEDVPGPRLNRTGLLRRYVDDELIRAYPDPAGDDGWEALYVPGQVIVSPADRGRAGEHLARVRGNWGPGTQRVPKRGNRPEPGPEGPDGIVYSLEDRGAHPLEIVQLLRDSGLDAGLNHVVSAFPHRQGYPADDPDEDRSPLRHLDPDSRAVGAGVRVAVIDTGYPIKAFRDVHRWFTTEAGGLRDDVDCDLAVDGDAVDDQPRNGLLDFQSGHGVFAAGLVRRVAPGARLLFLRALNTDGLGTEAGVAEAIRRAVGAGAHVLNLSLGFYTLRNEAPTGVAGAVREAVGSGVAVVAAAGNDATEDPTYPAALPGVLSVGALDGARPARFSNRGEWVRLWADGVELVSEYLDGDEDPDLLVRPASNGHGPADRPLASRFRNGQARWSGTSFACPLVTGTVAATLAHHPQGTAASRAAREVLARADDRGRVPIRYHL